MIVCKMAPHSSTLAWKIPWTEEPGGLQSMELLRVRHDWATSLCMKYSLGISNFLEKICSLSHSIVFLYFFALILFDNILLMIFVSTFMRDIGLYLSFFECNFILPTLLNRMGNILSFLNIWGNLCEFFLKCW